MIALKLFVCIGLTVSMVGDLHYGNTTKLNGFEVGLLFLDAAVKITAIFLIM